MDTELITDEMVAELRQGIKGLVERCGEQLGGKEQLHTLEQGMRQLLNRLGAQLTAEQVQRMRREQEKGPRRSARCEWAPLRLYNPYLRWSGKVDTFRNKPADASRRGRVFSD